MRGLLVWRSGMDNVELRAVPHCIPLLAQWHHAQWAHLNPGRTLADRIDSMQRRLGDALIPSTWVAVEKDVVMGSASLVGSDMETHPELTPWLASVFVAPEFRRRGIATQLVRRAMQEAQQGGINTLYLFTPDQQQLYASLGWEALAEETFHGDVVTLMKVDFPTHS